MMNDRPHQPCLLTVREAAQSLRVSMSLVYQLVEARKLACHRIGGPRGAIRISAADLQEYLAGCRYEREDRSPKPLRPRLKHVRLRAADCRGNQDSPVK